MIQQLDIEEFLQQSKGRLIIDVRSEGEYDYGHIPAASNLPLFNNEERKIVGTTYKQKSKDEALLIGLDIVGKKMSDFVRFVNSKTEEKKVFIHCWRGGMRSSSMAWLLNLFGYDVFLLKGGYKAYRNYALAEIRKNFKLIVIGGRTGSGKTDVLKKLKELGEQLIDLEALACHKGSAFGSLGQPKQPSTEHFENLLAEELKSFDINKAVWIEDESKTIGKVFIDKGLWDNMRLSPLFVIELPLKVRLKRLVNDYGENQIEGLEQSITNIKKRLGNEQWKNAIDALQAKDFQKAAELTLYYYDKAYDKGLLLKETKNIFRYTFADDDMELIAQTLLQEARKKYGN